jgi:two-component system phosphate regulon sensor histidine kinase PhoR
LQLLLVLAIGLCAIFYLRLRRIRRFQAQLVEAAERGRPVLLEKEEGGLPGYHLQRLVHTFNHLIAENANISDTGQGYLDQIQTTLGNLREAVVMVDRDNLIRLANPAFRDLVELNHSPLGKRLDTFLQGSAFQEFLIEVRGGRDGKRSELETLVGQRSVWLEVSAAPLPENPRTEEAFTLFVFHDITRQKSLERMRTEFVANVSHELRTPVTIIKGFTDTLIEDGPELSAEEQNRFLQKIKANSERLSTLLQDLLLLSRLESTEGILQRERLSLSNLLEEVTSHWIAGHEDRSWKFETRFAEGNDFVFVDSLRFSQLIVNLLENAVRHAGTVRKIEVRSRLREKGVEIMVGDDGCGIPAKDLPHVFQRFYRVSKSRSRESGGTGLGLSIVKHIVQQHGGEIRAESEPEKGTRVFIFFPYPERMAEDAVFRSLRRQPEIKPAGH